MYEHAYIRRRYDWKRDGVYDIQSYSDLPIDTAKVSDAGKIVVKGRVPFTVIDDWVVLDYGRLFCISNVNYIRSSNTTELTVLAPIASFSQRIFPRESYGSSRTLHDYICTITDALTKKAGNLNFDALYGFQYVTFEFSTGGKLLSENGITTQYIKQELWEAVGTNGTVTLADLVYFFRDDPSYGQKTYSDNPDFYDYSTDNHRYAEQYRLSVSVKSITNSGVVIAITESSTEEYWSPISTSQPTYPGYVCSPEYYLRKPEKIVFDAEGNNLISESYQPTKRVSGVQVRHNGEIYHYVMKVGKQTDGGVKYNWMASPTPSEPILQITGYEGVRVSPSTSSGYFSNYYPLVGTDSDIDRSGRVGFGSNAVIDMNEPYAVIESGLNSNYSKAAFEYMCNNSNLINFSIKFSSPKFYRYKQRVTLIFEDGETMESEIQDVRLSSTSDNYIYTCGNLKTRLSEKLK